MSFVRRWRRPKWAKVGIASSAPSTAIGIDVLIDDSPETLERALDAGMVAATILHPWNRELCEEEDIVSAPDWPTLAQRLEPVLA